MDDDPVLRELGAELERDDPALAAMLSGPGTPPRGHGLALALLLTALVGVGLLLAPAVTLGVMAMLMVIASPLLACWWGSIPGDGPAPRST
jgi:hypothetical protein